MEGVGALHSTLFVEVRERTLHQPSCKSGKCFPYKFHHLGVINVTRYVLDSKEAWNAS